MPASLRILAWIHVVTGAAGLALFALFLGVAAAAHDPAYDDELAFFVGGLGLLSLAYFMPSLIGGVGLLKRWPWARAIIWMESALLALAMPIGTALAGLNLWVLLSTRDVSADGGIAKMEAFILRFVRLFVLALVAMALLGLMIGAGYLLRDVIDPPREQILTPLPAPPPAMAPRQPIQ